MTLAASGFPGSAAQALSTSELAALVKQGMIQRQNQHFDEARRTFLRIRALCPGEPHAEIGLGAVCFSEGRFEEAIGYYREALTLDPANAYAYALLGESQIFASDSSAARISLRRACEIDPKGPYGRLAQSLLTFIDTLSIEETGRQDWPR
jgi:Flp pilus assembly protein TadD